MVDVSAKAVTRRVAEASCRVLLSAATVARLGSLPKGDAFAVARLAGIQGAKRTAELVPLAHPLPLDQVEVELAPADGGVEIRSRVVVTARTGAEMEAPGRLLDRRPGPLRHGQGGRARRGRHRPAAGEQGRRQERRLAAVGWRDDRHRARPPAARGRAAGRPALRPARPRRRGHRRLPARPPGAGGQRRRTAGGALRARARLSRRGAGHGRRPSDGRRPRAVDRHPGALALRRRRGVAAPAAGAVPRPRSRRSSTSRTSAAATTPTPPPPPGPPRRRSPPAARCGCSTARTRWAARSRGTCRRPAPSRSSAPFPSRCGTV